MNPNANELLELGKKDYHNFSRKSAVEKFRQAYSIDPNCKCAGWLAIGLAGANEWEEAKEFVASLEGNECDEILVAKGMLSDENGDYEDAIAFFNRALDSSPDKAYIFCMRGLAYAELNNPERAFADISKAQEVDEAPYVIRYFGLLHERFGNETEALNSYSKAIKQFPDDKRLRHNRGVHYYKKGNYQDALNDFNKAVELDRQLAWSYFLRGSAKAKLNYIPGAIFDIGKAIQLDSEDYRFWADRGMIRLNNGENQEALTDLNRALELNPNDKQSLFNRGLVRQKLNNFRGALSDYNKAIEINPNNAVYWAQRSVVKELLEDDLGALEDLDKALDLSKNYVWALRRRANVLSRNGQHELSIIDRIRYYENELVPKVEDDDPEFKEIYSEIHDHFHRVIKRKIENSSEKLIEYWPCFMYWGLEIGSTVSQGRSGFVHRGKYGMGYLCLSTKTLRIISIGTLSRKYARGLGMGPVRRFLLVLTNNFDMSSVERNDVVWEVPFSSIQGIALHDETLSVNTSVENWRVSASLPEHDQAIFAFLNLARSGGLNNVIDPRRLRLSQQKGTATSSDEIFKNIERLASLLNSGAITQEDFDQKKKELLARL